MADAAPSIGNTNETASAVRPWVDRTAEFKAHLASLTEWEVRVNKGYALKDLMSAAEINDPKTDVGYQWAKNLPLAELLARKAIPLAKDLSSSQLLNLMDSFLGLEASLLSNAHGLASTIFSCAYAHSLELLEGSLPAKAFFCAALKTVEWIVAAINYAPIYDVDEFPIFGAGEQRLPSYTAQMTYAETLGLLDEALQETTDEAIRTRLVFRRDLLKVVNTVVSGQTQDVIGLPALIDEALPHFDHIHSETEPYTDPDIFRTECTVWLGLLIPVPKASPLSSKQTKAVFHQLFDNLRSLSSFFQLQSIQRITFALEGFHAKRPLLFPRAALSLMLSESSRAVLPNVRFPDLPPEVPAVSALVLKTISRHYGAPLIEQVFIGDAQALEDVVSYRYRNETTAPSDAQWSTLKRHVVEQIQQWVLEAYTPVLRRIWIALLRNRGRGHRDFANMLLDLGAIWHLAVDCDHSYFCAHDPLGGKADAAATEWRLKSTVLTALATELIVVAEHYYLALTTELKLHSTAELLPIMWLQHSLTQTHAEALSPLVIPTAEAIPAKRYRTRQGKSVPLHAPAVTSRTMCQPSSDLLARFEAVRAITSSLYAVGSALKAVGLLDLNPPSSSVVPPAIIFDNRFAAFRQVERPLFSDFHACMRQSEEFGKAGIKKAIDFGLNHLSNALEPLKSMKADGRLEGLAGATLTTLEGHCKHNLVALRMLSKCCSSEASNEAAVAKIKEQFTIEIAYHDGFPELHIKLIVN